MGPQKTFNSGKLHHCQILELLEARGCYGKTRLVTNKYLIVKNLKSRESLKIQ